MIEVKTNSLKEFYRKLSNIGKEFQKAYNIPGQINKVLFNGGNNMRNHIIKEMRNTKRAPWSYKRGNKKHFPSLPGNYPAVDGGEAIRSIAFDVRIKTESAQLEIGNSGGAPYLKFLEGGTKKMESRPWLKPTTNVYEPNIRKDIENIVPDSVITFMVNGLK
jgi:hypothetical protein